MKKKKNKRRLKKAKKKNENSKARTKGNFELTRKPSMTREPRDIPRGNFKKLKNKSIHTSPISFNTIKYLMQNAFSSLKFEI
jgi:hypothetical protein